MNKVAIRVMNDYVDFNKNKQDGIYLWIDKTNIFQQYALIIGPENTPYFGGFYFFNIKFPDNYPDKPPEVKLMTINGKVRFNPNLYQCGKVCLSILGTWSGPSWKPIMNIRLVLNSIRSLMGEYPIQTSSAAALANGAVESFTLAAAIDLPRGLRINTVSPNVLTEATSYHAKFAGYHQVSAQSVADAYVKSILGKQTGQIYKLD